MKRLNELLESLASNLVDKMEKRRGSALVAILPIASVALAFVVGGFLLLLLEFNPITIYGGMLTEAFGDPYSIARIFVKATPLIFTALAFGFTFNGFLFNIGAQGQFYVGALMAVFISLSLGGALHPAILLPLVFLASGAAGGLWASFAGWAKSRFSANEFLVTMLSTYVATSVLNYFISGPLQEPKGEYPQTARIPDSSTIPTMGDTDLHYGFFVAVLVALLAYFILNHTSLGFKIRHVGINTESARYGGINVKRVYIISFFLAGAL
ncbi:ABC transporter permease, partial [Candidatus Bipolaricaulota bacterium]|nr:ABC transporter permease [Candidatus Bipolaricaulota bacterium]